MTDDDLFRLREARIVTAVVREVSLLETFHPRPIKRGNIVQLAWLWAITRQAISPSVAEYQLREQTYALLEQLRPRLWLLQDLSEPRTAVILHVGLLIGADALLAQQDLWAALARQDYTAAGLALLDTSWASMAGDDRAARRKMLAIVRIMQTGEPPVGRLQ